MSRFHKVSTLDLDPEKGVSARAGAAEDRIQLIKKLWSDRPLYVRLAVVAVTVVVVYKLCSGGGDPFARRDRWKYGSPRLATSSLSRDVPGPRSLLTAAAPARSYKDALRPDLRYLTLDSWSGMTGQHLTALSLLYLAQLTQRVAIIPSWRDQDHYGDAMIRMSDLFDLEKYRNVTGSLFVEWDDVKPLDRNHEKTDSDEIGCVMGNNPFEGGRSFYEHNLAQSVWRVPRPGPEAFQHSVESFVLFDFDQADRYSRVRRFAKDNNHSHIAANLLDDQLLCYSNLWDLNHASAHANGVAWYEGFRGQQRAEGTLKDMLPISQRGTHPEWWAVGQYVDFSPAVWDIALNATLQTLRTRDIPKNLVTVHLRRGDFKEWCSTGHNCTPAIDRYVEKVEPMLALQPKGTKVLVTTDEQDDDIFLSSIDALGWYRIDHRRLGTFSILEERYGDAARWYDAAIDQAILSLGSGFVGTSGSQVSLVTELRVAAWNRGQTSLVERPA
ncbi:hypothetical protein JCM11491_001016 [Sporobolomyces phaffii]